MKKRPAPRRKSGPGSPRSQRGTAPNLVPPSQRPRTAEGRSVELPRSPGPKKPTASGGRAQSRERTSRAPVEGLAVVHVASADRLARVGVQVAEEVEQAVLVDRKRADRAIATALRKQQGLSPSDQRFVAEAVFALFRWKGWVDRLKETRMDRRLLASWLLDSNTLHPVCRLWARGAGLDPDRLVPSGDAPSWTALAEGFKRSLGGPTFSADPWALFPAWLRDRLPLPHVGSDRKRQNLALLAALQKRPSLWVRVQGAEPDAVWEELRELGLKPWVHRTRTDAAKLPVDSDVNHLPPFVRGTLEIQDLASQAVAVVCDPEPGERWWDACAGAGGKALHLASLMRGKGVVVASDVNEHRLKELVRRCRRSPFRNVSSKVWSGKHTVGKSRSYDGVLVDAPCSAIGTWRRNPDARWSIDPEAVARLVEIQGQLLAAASAGVKVGGTLVYSVCTFTPEETTGVVHRFLEIHKDFRLDPFPNPLSQAATDGTMLIQPQDADSDAMFVARMTRVAAPAAPAATPADPG